MKGILIVPNFALLDPTWRIFWGGFLLHKLIFIFNFAEIQGEQKKKKKKKKIGRWINVSVAGIQSNLSYLMFVQNKQLIRVVGWRSGQLT